jgi:hypothetical protein
MPQHDPSKRHRSPEGHRRKETSDSSEPVSRSIKSEAPGSWSLLEKVRSMFSWIADRVTEEAREEEAVSVSESSAKRVLSQYSSRDLLRRADSSIARIELSKQILLQQFGTRAQAFVERYVFPVVEPIKSFIQSIREGLVAPDVKDAVGSLELLAMMHDENRLFRKIRDSLETKTRDAILGDIAFILSYPSEALEDAFIPAAQRGAILREIEEKQQPLLLELEDLLSVHPTTFELIPLFEWRLGIDQKRQRLHDASMQIIDEKIRKGVPLWSSLKDLPSKEISPFLEELDLEAEKDLTWPLSVLELEEVSVHLRQIVEEDIASREDKKLLQIFEQMRSQVESLIESVEGEEHEEALSRITDQIKAIEQLLGQDPS